MRKDLTQNKSNTKETFPILITLTYPLEYTSFDTKHLLNIEGPSFFQREKVHIKINR